MGDSGVVSELGVATASAEDWELAARRAEVIARLASGGAIGHQAVDSAAAELGLSRRQIYKLVQRWWEGSGLVTDLIPGKSTGGRGGERLPEPVEAVIREALRTRYLTRQRRSLTAVHREVARECRLKGFPVPSRGSLMRRAAKVDPAATVAARQGRDAARSLQSAGGVAPEVTGLLEQVQMDHTVVDVTVVDERHRLPVGRPYITIAIDVLSRCIVGMVVTLEAPSALSVGLCLAHMVADKRPWLERLGVQAVWPMSGKPLEIYVDNAAEFKSEALRRGCEQHGIEVRWRPPGQPHFGGIVERVIGIFMEMVHELPGTTFSNPQQRGRYDSEKLAVLTLRELERWLALAVSVYHGQVHSTLGQTPAGQWAQAAATAGVAPIVTSETAFLVDFLPVIRRTLTRTGFVIDHVHYYRDALKPLIARRDRLGRLVLRRDPRDLSRIWALDPDSSTYIQVPYRTLSHPPISLWEHKAAVAALRQQGRAQVNEDVLFRMVEQMRTITDTAAKTSRKARRSTERRQAIPAPKVPRKLASPPQDSPGPLATPFAVIEEW